MDEESVKIELIRIRLGDKVVELTPDQARKLYSELGGIFGPTPYETIYIPLYRGYDYPPVYVNPNTEPFPEKWVVTCNAYRETPNTLEIDVK